MKYIIKFLIFLTLLTTINSNIEARKKRNARQEYLENEQLRLQESKKKKETPPQVIKPKYNFGCPEKHITVIVQSHNNEKWVGLCLNSLKNQNYTNFNVIYINNYSTDNTAELVDKYIELNNLVDKFILINNIAKLDPLTNLSNAVNTCKNDNIILTIDDNDWLTHEIVLKIINSIYQDKKIWLTYGKYKTPEGEYLKYSDYSDEIISNQPKNPSTFQSNLKTFYAGLFKLIKPEDLLYTNEFYPTMWEKLIMFTMMEMSACDVKDIENTIYNYNDQINNCKAHLNLKESLSPTILVKTPYISVTWEDVMNAG